MRRSAMQEYPSDKLEEDEVEENTPPHGFKT